MAKKRHRRKPGPRPSASDARTETSDARTETSDARTETSTARQHAKRPRGNAALRPEAPATPASFSGYEVAWAKLWLVRVVVFGMLACDSLLQLSHAPRYGSGFNVAQLRWLDDLGPGRVGYAVGQLACAYLLMFAAAGVATRVVLP